MVETRAVSDLLRSPQLLILIAESILGKYFLRSSPSLAGPRSSPRRRSPNPTLADQRCRHLDGRRGSGLGVRRPRGG
eukprot:9411149-Pyramimonas_sp.AAC.1